MVGAFRFAEQEAVESGHQTGNHAHFQPAHNEKEGLCAVMFDFAKGRFFFFLINLQANAYSLVEIY